MAKCLNEVNWFLVRITTEDGYFVLVVGLDPPTERETSTGHGQFLAVPLFQYTFLKH